MQVTDLTKLDRSASILVVLLLIFWCQTLFFCLLPFKKVGVYDNKDENH